MIKVYFIFRTGQNDENINLETRFTLRSEIDTFLRGTLLKKCLIHSSNVSLGTVRRGKLVRFGRIRIYCTVPTKIFETVKTFEIDIIKCLNVIDAFLLNKICSGNVFRPLLHEKREGILYCLLMVSRSC